jgi:hypothetical protein
MTGKDLSHVRELHNSQTGITIFSHYIHNYMDLLQEKHNDVYEDLIRHLRRTMVAIAKLSKGYLPPEIFSPETILEMTIAAGKMVQEINPNYVLALDKLTQIYDMKLVTFAVDQNSNTLIVTFPILIKEYGQGSMSLYEIETVHVPILDRNLNANSYTKAVMNKPYIAVNNDYYIQMRLEELQMCKEINFQFYCEELFLVKHKTKHSCESAIFYELPAENIKKNCEFDYFYNKTVTPSVLDGGEQIILANMHDQKNLQCSHNHHLAQPITNFPYVMVNRTILCNCRIETDLSYLYKSIGSCDKNRSSTIMHFTKNLAFNLYFNDMINNTNTLLMAHEQQPDIPDQFQIFTNSKIPEFPIYLEDIRDPLTLDQPENLNKLIHIMHGSYGVIKNPNNMPNMEDNPSSISNYPNHNLQNYYLNDESVQMRYDHNTKWKFLDSWELEIFQLVGSVVAFCGSIFSGYLLNKHSKVSATVTSMALHKLSGAHGSPVEMASQMKTTKVMCQGLTLSVVIAIITFVGICIYLYRLFKTFNLCRGIRYTNMSSLYLFASLNDRFLPLKLATIKGHITLFSLKGCLTTDHVKLNQSTFWDTIQINWEEVELLYNSKPINIPADITLSIFDKIRARHIIKSPNPIYSFLVKQGNTWYNLEDKEYHRNPGVPNMDE